MATSPSTSTEARAGRRLAGHPTIVGQKYDVKFRYTANPESSDPAPTMAVKVDGAPVGPTFSDTRAGGAIPDSPRASSGRTAASSFTATTATTKLTFASADPARSDVRRRSR